MHLPQRNGAGREQSGLHGRCVIHIQQVLDKKKKKKHREGGVLTKLINSMKFYLAGYLALLTVLIVKPKPSSRFIPILQWI